MFERLEQIEGKYQELNDALASPEVISDSSRYQKTAKAHSELALIVERYREYKDLKRGIADTKTMLADEPDAELKAMAEEELFTLQSRLQRAEEELKLLLVPKDPNDERNVILEIRAGPGGQSVNTTYSAVRITHMPTNTVVSCQDEKSQIKNREKAMRVLRSRLYEVELERQQAELAKERKTQVGTGDRSEKIRTYNFPQNRVTDHRFGLTLHQLPEVMDGKLQPLIDAAIAHFQAEKLKQETVAV